MNGGPFTPQVPGVATTAQSGMLSAADKAKLENLTAAGVKSYYFDDGTSDLGGGYMVANPVPVAKAEDADTIVTGAGAAPVSAAGDIYASPIGSPGVTSIPVGTWDLHIWASVDSTSGSTTLLDVEVYTRTAAGAETLRGTFTTPALTTAATLYDVTWTIAAPIAINATDRIVFKVVARRTVGASARTVTWYHNGSARYSHVETSVEGAAIEVATATAPGLVPCFPVLAAKTWAQLLALAPSALLAGARLSVTTYVDEWGTTQTLGAGGVAGELVVECRMDRTGAYVWRAVGGCIVTGLEDTIPAVDAILVGIRYHATDTMARFLMATATTWIVPSAGDGPYNAGFGPSGASRVWWTPSSSGYTGRLTGAPVGGPSTGFDFVYRAPAARPGAAEVMFASGSSGLGRGEHLATGYGGGGGADYGQLYIRLGNTGAWLALAGATNEGGYGAVHCISVRHKSDANPMVTRYSFDGAAVAEVTHAAGAWAAPVAGDEIALGGLENQTAPFTGVWMAVKHFSTARSDAKLLVASAIKTSRLPTQGDTIDFDFAAHRIGSGIEQAMEYASGNMMCNSKLDALRMGVRKVTI